MLPQLKEIAEEAVKHYTNADDAVKWIYNQVDKNQELKRALILPAIREAARTAFHGVLSGMRRKLKGKKAEPRKTNAQKQAPKRVAKTQKPRGRAIMEAAHKKFLERWIVNGKRLGDNNRADIRKAKEESKSRRLGEWGNELFFEAIERRMPAEETKVKEVLTDKQAKRLWEGVSRKTKAA